MALPVPALLLVAGAEEPALGTAVADPRRELGPPTGAGEACCLGVRAVLELGAVLELILRSLGEGLR